MTKLEAVAKAITELSADDLAKLRAYIDDLEDRAFDAKLENDSKAGKLDALIAKASAAHTSGDAEDL
ncbi:MAG: hypothetical protein IKE66_15025 [Hyphomicrobium sp.]|nr:hypothetical protein [Hyphomicrobium sp.]